MPLSRINSASIANSAISAADIADGTITAIKIISVANTQITGNIVSSQITSVANTQISGNIISSQITSVANTQISGNIISSQIVPSVTLTTPIISGNLNLDSAGTTGIRVPSANTIALHTAGTQQAGITSAGLLQFNSGYGSVATAYGCRAWVNFNGTGTVAIRASGNVSSITDNGVGDYTVNFTTAMTDANYAISYSASQDGISQSGLVASIYSSAAVTSSSVRLGTVHWDAGSKNIRDIDQGHVHVFR